MTTADVNERPHPATMPDARRYRRTIKMNGVARQLAVTDPIAAPAIAALIAYVRGKVR